MDFFEAQAFFQQLYPDRLVTFSFDDRCHRIHEVIFTEGLPNMHHHVECDHVKVDIADMPTQYVKIKPHRFNVGWANMKACLAKNDVYLHPEQLEYLRGLKEDADKKAEYDGALVELQALSGMSKAAIEAKLAKGDE
jgi:hypothetical protein